MKDESIFGDIKGKKILITGASGGIGSSIASLAGSYGASVGIHYNKNEAGARSTAEGIEKNGGTARIFRCNLLENKETALLIKSFLDTFGGIDVLINNAGMIYGYEHFLEMDEKSWNDTFAVNAKAPFFLSKEAFPHMRDQGGGKIINISSVSAKYGGSDLSIHYGAAKAALDTVTVGLARAGAQHNILVNSVRAGFVDTPFHSKMGRTDIESRVSLTPLKRAGQPIDIARMVLFLASGAGDYITGEVITIAGGD